MTALQCVWRARVAVDRGLTRRRDAYVSHARAKRTQAAAPHAACVHFVIRPSLTPRARYTCTFQRRSSPCPAKIGPNDRITRSIPSAARPAPRITRGSNAMVPPERAPTATVTDLATARRGRTPASASTPPRTKPANRRFDTEKVERLKAEIAAGRYEIDAASVADRFIEHERNQ